MLGVDIARIEVKGSPIVVYCGPPVSLREEKGRYVMMEAWVVGGLIVWMRKDVEYFVLSSRVSHNMHGFGSRAGEMHLPLCASGSCS